MTQTFAVEARTLAYAKMLIMLRVLMINLAIAAGINLVLFLIAFRLQSDKLTDISYALSFLGIDLAAFYYAHRTNLYSILLFLLVATWAVRIGGFLLIRVVKVGKDRRFDDMRNDFVRFGKFWAAQAITAWVVLLPVIMAQYRGGSIGVLACAGMGICLAGVLIEAVADYQKYVFKQENSGKNTWIQNGLWAYSRHPNYFGEIAVWVGMYVYCFSALGVLERVIGLGSPGLITLLLLFVSGVPILEKSAEKRWGKTPGYQEYKANTRLLLPVPRLTGTPRT